MQELRDEPARGFNPGRAFGDLELDASDREEIDGLIAEGVADLRAGRTVPAEDVLREIEAMEAG